MAAAPGLRRPGRPLAVVPFLHGLGTTRFLSSKTFRNGQQSVYALDILALMDSLRIDKAILAGYDWGGRATFDQTATAFDNPDYVSVVINNYRWRLGLAPGDPRLDSIEQKLSRSPTIGVATIAIDGAYDPFAPAGNGSSYRDKFTGKYEHRTFQVGHNLPQEASEAFAQAVIDVDRF